MEAQGEKLKGTARNGQRAMADEVANKIARINHNWRRKLPAIMTAFQNKIGLGRQRELCVI